MLATAVPVVRSRRTPAYALDTGDKLRIVVFGQEGLSNSYFVDAAGQVTMPLIGAVKARGLTTQQLARAVAAKLRAGFIREPHVAIEVETYRPFFILGEVTQPGPVSVRAQHDGGDRGRDRRRLHAARLSLRRQDRPADGRRRRARPQLGAAADARCSPATPSSSRNAGSERESASSRGRANAASRTLRGTLRRDALSPLGVMRRRRSGLTSSDASSGSRRSAARPPSPTLRGSCRARRSGSRARRPDRRRSRCRRRAST